MDVGLTRRNIGRLVLLTWAVMLAWLARREFAKESAGGVAERTRRLEPSAQYFAVLAGGRQIGVLNRSADTLVDGVRLTEQFVLDLPVGDSTRQLARGMDYYLSRALRLRNLTRNVFGLGLAERLDAALGPDSVLRITDIEGPASTGQAHLRVESDAIFAGMLPYRAAFGGHLHTGESFTVPLIELGEQKTRPLIVRVTAESTFIVPDSASWDSTVAQWVMATADTVRAWRLEHDAPGGPTLSWVDAGGALIRQETAGGLTFVRTAFDIAGNNYRRVRRAERSTWRRAIPGVLALTSTGLTPDTSASMRRFLYQRDTLAARGGGEALLGGRQALHGDTLTVQRDAPRRDAADHPSNAREAAWDLAAQNPEMGTLGSPELDRAKTARDTLRALTLWVAHQVATDSAEGAYGTALNALRYHRANADGKARLLATMARARGIPARVVTGIAVLPEGAFAHAWTELWLGRWIAADPSFGHFPASASLIRIRVGERSRPVDLLPLVASARFLPLKGGR